MVGPPTPPTVGEVGDEGSHGSETTSVGRGRRMLERPVTLPAALSPRLHETLPSPRPYDPFPTLASVYPRTLQWLKIPPPPPRPQRKERERVRLRLKAREPERARALPPVSRLALPPV